MADWNKRVTVLVYDGLSGIGRFPSTANLVSVWEDVAFPGFSASVSGGYSDLTLTLPRPYGRLREPYEDGTDSSLQHGYRVDVYVADADTLTDTNPDNYGRLVYRGTIEDYATKWSASGQQTTVQIAPLTRIAEQSPQTLTYATQSIVTSMKDLVDNHLPSLQWDANNTAAVSAPGSAFAFARESGMAILRKGAQTAGADWLTFITPAGNVRFFVQSRTGTPAAGSSRHILALGREVTEAELGKSARNRAKKVTVVYQYGESSAQAGDYTANDPRAVIITAPDIASATDAAALASAWLTALNKITLRASVTVAHDAYDIESIGLGDVVRVIVPRQLGTNSFAGYNDYNDNDLIVMGLNYSLDKVTLQLDQEPARVNDLMVFMKKQLDTLGNQAVDNLLKGATLSLDANNNVLVKGGAGTGSGAGVVSIANASTLPTTNPAGGGLLYSNAGALTWKGSAGTITPIAPA